MSNWILAIDPGDKHVGWATWFHWSTSTFGAGELAASAALPWIEHQLLVTSSASRLVVIERFVLYEHKAAEQSWQPMQTSEMIGAIKWMCSKYQVPWTEQGADIQKPMEAQLRARGIDLLQKGRHAKSAQLHLWHRLLKDGFDCHYERSVI